VTWRKSFCAADPENTQAKTIIPVLVIRAWVSGIETDPQKVQDALKQLMEQQKADPKNPDLLLYIAMAQIRQADTKSNAVGAQRERRSMRTRSRRSKIR